LAILWRGTLHPWRTSVELGLMQPRLQHREISGALAGASFVAVTQVATRDKISTALCIAVVLFAFVLPFLLLFWLRSPVKTAELEVPGGVEGLESFSLIVLLDIVGFAALFFHFGLIPGLLFVFAALLAIWVLLVQVRFSRALLWDLIRRYPSLPKRLLQIALTAMRGGESHRQT